MTAAQSKKVINGLRQHIFIEAPSPRVDDGRYAAKRVSGEPCVVEADIFRDGHDVIRAVVLWKRAQDAAFSEAPMIFVENDRWSGEFPLADNAEYVFTIQAWTDAFASWLADFRKRVDAGQHVASEGTEGAAMIESVLPSSKGKDEKLLKSALAGLHGAATAPTGALKAVDDPAVEDAMLRLQPRSGAVTFEPELRVFADRPRAEFGAWYEFFVRSQGTDALRGGTFADAEKRLPDIREMGFDVLYLPPIHPIGRTARKGPNNSLTAGPNDPGCPWAIGNEEGGHTAIEPALGTLADFRHFVARARTLGMEVALDFAVQCSPDHPWVQERPEWFYRRPDGTIKYAENPPKKYEDIYPLNFDSIEAEELWRALRDAMLFWVGHGVKIFRVDNPHTKAFPFWAWAIAEIRAAHPDVIFLAEAFTRPKVMKALAKLGFSQSYTYFTWRNEKTEIAAYLTELATTSMREYYRPNFFANTPDILHEYLQTGGPGAFRIRATLAATLSPTWGIYSGFELCENDPVPGSEEYMDSEKFQIKPRDWNAPGNIKAYIGRLNAIRKENAALRKLSNITFFEVENERMMGYVKMSGDKSNVIITVVSLDPRDAQHGWLLLPFMKMGLPANARLDVTDLLTGRVFNWGDRNWARLTPESPAHVLRVERRTA